MAEGVLELILRIKKQGSAKGAEKEVRDLASTIKTAESVMGGAAMAAGALAAVYQATVAPTLAYAKEVRDLSRTIGATTEESSRLIQVSDDVGVSSETLSKAMETAIRKGVRPTIAGMGELADEYNAIQDPIAKSKFLMDTFGKSGADLAPLMEKGKAGIESASAAISENMVLTAAQVQANREHEIAVDNLTDAYQGAVYEVGNTWIPTLTAAINTTMLLLTWTQQIEQAVTSNAQAVAESSVPYTEYEAAVRGLAEAQGFAINEGGDLVRIIQSSHGPIEQLIQANYLLTESERAASFMTNGATEEMRLQIEQQNLLKTATLETAAAGDVGKKVWLEAQKGLAGLNLETEKRIAVEQALALASGAMTAEDLIRNENIANLNEQLALGTVSQEEYIVKMSELAAGAVTVRTSFEEMGHGQVAFSAAGDKVVPVLKTETEQLKLQAPAADGAKKAFFQYGELLQEQMKPGGNIEKYIIGLSMIAGAAKTAADNIRGIPTIPGNVTTVGAPPPRAFGGPVEGGQMYTVGELGPETFMAPTDGYILPHGGAATQSVGGLAGGRVVNISLTIVEGPLSMTDRVKLETETLPWLKQQLESL